MRARKLTPNDARSHGSIAQRQREHSAAGASTLTAHDGNANGRKGREPARTPPYAAQGRETRAAGRMDPREQARRARTLAGTVTVRTVKPWDEPTGLTVREAVTRDKTRDATPLPYRLR